MHLRYVALFILLSGPFIAISTFVSRDSVALQKSALRMAHGVVYHDANGNRKHDREEKPLAGIRVSNGVQITKTDSQGRYELPVTDDTILFVAKPRGWQTRLNELNLPQFYYIHKPNGLLTTHFATPESSRRATT